MNFNPTKAALVNGYPRRTSDESIRQDFQPHASITARYAVTRGDPRLGIIVAALARSWALFNCGKISSLHNARVAGILLIVAKPLVKAGHWLDWVYANSPMTIRRSQQCMLLARRLRNISECGFMCLEHFTPKDVDRMTKGIPSVEFDVEFAGSDPILKAAFKAMGSLETIGQIARNLYEDGGMSNLSSMH